jgi:hypothetical protein
MMIKIEKQNKFYIWLNVEIKKNNQKNKDQNWHKK